MCGPSQFPVVIWHMFIQLLTHPMDHGIEGLNLIFPTKHAILYSPNFKGWPLFKWDFNRRELFLGHFFESKSAPKMSFLLPQLYACLKVWFLRNNTIQQAQCRWESFYESCFGFIQGFVLINQQMRGNCRQQCPFWTQTELKGCLKCDVVLTCLWTYFQA